MSSHTLVEVAANLVATRSGNQHMSAEELLVEIGKVHAGLKNLAEGNLAPVTAEAEAAKEEQKPQISLKKAFGRNEVVCMLCGKGGFKTLARHLATAHNMKPNEYRKQFGIKATQSLAAKTYSDSRRQLAQDRGLADNLAKARAVRMANIEAKKNPPKKNGTKNAATPVGAAAPQKPTPQKPKAAPKAKAAKAPKAPKAAQAGKTNGEKGKAAQQ